MSDTPQPLYRRCFVAAELLFRHPPRWHHPNKDAVYGLACPPDSHHDGTIGVSRWPALAVPEKFEPAVHVSVLETRAGVFDYSPASAQPAVEWHLNFAAADLFCAYAGGLFAQDEMQVAEHPALASVREALLASGLSTQVSSSQQPTPILVRNVERRCRIATDRNADDGRPAGLYGNQFARAPVETVRRAVTVLAPPTRSNILAIEAPAYGSGTYRTDEIEFILSTAYSGFVAARLEASLVPNAPPRIAIHTGFWGCGAYGGNRTVMAMLQILAARLAQIDRLVFHTFDRAGAAVLRQAVHLMDELIAGLTQPSGVKPIIAGIEKLKFQWGVTDGN